MKNINMNKKKPTFELWEVLIITLIASIIMSGTTGYAVYRNKKAADCSSVTDNPHISEFLNSYNSIITSYYADIDESELVNAAISGMLTYLDDPYTTYLNESSSEYLQESLKGTYEGIGIEVDENAEEGTIRVNKVFADSPAAKAGVLADDIIRIVNSEDVNGKTATEVVAIIKSSNNKKVSMAVERNGELLTFEMTLATLFVPVVSANTYDSNEQKVGYLGISKFNDTVYDQFNARLEELEKQNINSLIIDLRGNTGGYLKGASEIASIFLKEGSLIYSLKTKLETTKYKSETNESRSYKVYVLINSGTASASEVLAAALKHSYGATLIGTTSYGKGKVQQTSSLTDGSMLKYTTAEWLTPKGDCIDGVGLVPDNIIELNEEYANNPTTENDNQLQTAILEISK